ncbi:MAG: energy transducer TonB [Flavobacteriaceae bacterium]
MRILFIILLFVFTSFSNVFAQSQTQTTYEKKVLEVKVKYLSILYYGYEKELTFPEKHHIESLIKDKSEEQEAAVLANSVMNYAMTHSESEIDNLLKRFQNEMEIAEKLKTDVDVKREKEKKYEYTDRGSIQKSIKSSFLQWSQKGEFEKQADYEARLQKQSQSKFTEICMEEIKKKINSFRSSDLSMNLLTYDAEKEVFPTLFKFNKKEWKSNQKISIDKAQNFKEKEWKNFQWQKEESNWCFIDNDMLPSVISLKSNSHYTTINLPLPNQEEITVAFNDLGIESPYLKNFVFNYLIAIEKENQKKKEEEEEKKREKEENSTYFPKFLEVQASFPGGMEKFRKYIKKNYKLNIDRNERGTVEVQFVVEKDGSLTNIKVIRDIGFGTGQEAIRILKESPKWNPGIKNGKPVRVIYTMPIIAFQ